MDSSSSATRSRSSVAFVPETREPTLQVSGLEEFEGSRWRECILYYLFGVWAGKDKVVYRPKIDFGYGIALQLDGGAREYFATGSAVRREYPSFGSGAVLIVSWAQSDVEQGLVRFVKNDLIKMLVIRLREGEIRLWKLPQRSRLGIASIEVPTYRERFERSEAARAASSRTA